MSDAPKKSLTIFKSDRHEDIAAILLAALVVISVLLYMAFITPTVMVKADTDGTVFSLNVADGAMVKKGDIIYTLSVKEKKWKGDQVEVTVKEKSIKAKTSGKVVKVLVAAGADAKKGKTPILELEHEKGTLP